MVVLVCRYILKIYNRPATVTADIIDNKGKILASVHSFVAKNDSVVNSKQN
jgi:hypothetical protein